LGEGLDFDIAPGPHGIRIRNAIDEPSLEICSLPIRKRCFSQIAENTLPDRFSDTEPFSETEAIDPEGVQ
jgi:hypothetical protein